MILYSVFAIVCTLRISSAQVTSLYGTVPYGTTKLLTFVELDASTQASASYDSRWQQPAQQSWQTPAPYTFAPYTFAPYTYQYAYTSAPYDQSRYGGAMGAAAGQSQGGRGVSVGGSASSGGRSSSSSSSSGQQRPYDSRYSGQSSASSYNSGRYDPYAQQATRPYDSRRPQQSDPRYQQSYRQEVEQPIDYSQYPPTPKTLILSENSIYVWWTDPAMQGGSNRRAQATPADKDVKYTVKYSRMYARQGEQADEQTMETGSAREFSAKSLEPGTDYTFSVKANRNGKETGWSAPVVNRTLEQLPQEPPTNIKVVATDRDAAITLSPPENFKGAISSYIFLYAPSGGSGNVNERKWQELQIRGGYVGQKEVTGNLVGLVPGEEYFYTVQAVNSRGSSQFSDIQSFKTQSGPVYPSYPTRSPYGADYGRDQYGRDPYGRDQTTRSPYEDYNQNQNYEEQTTPDYYAAYRTTAYPGYDDNTPDYYGRYNADARASTPDYYGRYEGQTAEETTPDYYAERASTVLQSFTEPPAGAAAAGATDSLYWSPYWAAATVPSSERGSGPEPPTDVRVEVMAGNGESVGDQVEALVTFVPSASNGVSDYEVLYTYDPTVSDDLWQIETIPGGETQGILVRLTPNTRVYVKVRARGAGGNSQFSETIPLDTVAYNGQPQQPHEADPYAQAGQSQGEQDQQHGADQQGHSDHQGAEEDRDPVDHPEEDADTAHTRTNRT